MANQQLVIGAVAGLGLVIVLVAVFAGESEAPSDRPSASSGVESSARPEPSNIARRPSPNALVSRVQSAGGLQAAPREGPRALLLKSADGSPARSALLPRRSLDRPLRPTEAGDVLEPGAHKPWPLDRDGIQGAVREALPEVRECYDAWVQQNPSLGGRVTMTFTIEPVVGQEGARVTQARVSDQGLGHALMEGCVVQVFEDLRFQAPADGKPMNVTYPLDFSNGQLDAGSR